MENKEKFGEGTKITMYRTPSCGCCGGYADALKEKGFEVEVIKIKDLTEIKEKYKLPANKQSCHTMVMGNYFIEGHVPMEAVEKLLKEKPQIDGIGLPGMPAGTPGMRGVKKAPYKVYQSVNSQFSEFLEI